MNSITLLQSHPVLCRCVRPIRHKPWIPKFKLIRQFQPWVKLFDPDSLFIGGKMATKNATPSEIRQHLQRNGLMPPMLFQDKPINTTHSGRVFDAYAPPEGDGRSSLLSREGVSQQLEVLTKKGKSYKSTMTITKHKPRFTVPSFPVEAEAIYMEVNSLLKNFVENEDRLLQLTTEKAFVEMTNGLDLRTVEWKFHGSIEPPRVVYVRAEEVMSKSNLYGQVTVRFHTQQSLAIYDRFGRLIFGHPTSPIDILEYIVFENHITDEYGIWRIHAKMVPPWATTRTSSHITQKIEAPAVDNLEKQLPSTDGSVVESKPLLEQ